jgi:TrkA domain protein
MPVELRQTRLPGVGTKFSFRTAHGSRVAVIQHLDGSRELYVFARAADDEPRAVLLLVTPSRSRARSRATSCSGATRS